MQKDGDAKRVDLLEQNLRNKENEKVGLDIYKLLMNHGL